MEDSIQKEHSYDQFAAMLTDILLQGQCRDGMNSMAKLRKEFSYYGWIPIGAHRAVIMPNASGISHCVVEFFKSNGYCVVRLREDLGNPHYSFWL